MNKNNKKEEKKKTEKKIEETKPIEENKTIETKPTESKPTEESKPVETKPTEEQKPTEPKPTETPTEKPTSQDSSQNPPKDNRVKKIIDELRSETANFKDISQIPKLVVKAIEVAEKNKDLTGEEKKDLVIQAIVEFVDRTDVMDSILPLLPPLIDQFIIVNGNGINVNKNVFYGFYKCICCKVIWGTKKSDVIEEKPIEGKPADAKPNDAKPEDVKPEEAKQDVKPEEKKEETKPTEENPVKSPVNPSDHILPPIMESSKDPHDEKEQLIK